MAQVALAQKPLEVAVAGRADLLAAQRGALVAVALRVGLVALLAVVAIDQRAGGDGLRLGRPEDCAAHGPWRELAPNAKLEAAPTATAALSVNEKNCKTAPHHCPPPLRSMKPLANLLKFKGQAHAIDPGEAGAGEAEARRKAEAHALGQLPADQRGNVVRGVAHGQRKGVSQAAVGLRAGDELLRAEGAFPAAGRAAQRARGSDGVAELPGRVAEVLSREMKFSLIFQSLRLEERISFSSASC